MQNGVLSSAGDDRAFLCFCNTSGFLNNPYAYVYVYIYMHVHIYIYICMHIHGDMYTTSSSRIIVPNKADCRTVQRCPFNYAIVLVSSPEMRAYAHTEH